MDTIKKGFNDREFSDRELHIIFEGTIAEAHDGVDGLVDHLKAVGSSEGMTRREWEGLIIEEEDKTLKPDAIFLGDRWLHRNRHINFEQMEYVIGRLEKAGLVKEQGKAPEAPEAPEAPVDDRPEWAKPGFKLKKDEEKPEEKLPSWVVQPEERRKKHKGMRR